MQIKTIFVSSTQKGSGSIIVTMGLMQILKSKIRSVGFFRPIVNDTPENDNDISFMLDYFKLKQTYDESYAFSKNEFEAMMADGKLSEAIEHIIAKVNNLKDKKDFVLIEGIPKAELSNSLVFDVNLELAKNLDADFISIINARNKTIEEISNEITIESDSMKTHSVREFMMFINRIDPENMLQLEANCAKDDMYLMPEEPELELVTIREIAEQLEAKTVFGTTKDLRRVVSSNIVAAMQSEHYIEKIEEKSMIIVPGDRSDVILSTVLALYSKNYPNAAGIIITGGLRIADSIKKLLNGLDSFSLPILSTTLDTYQTATKISEIRAKISSLSERKIALGMGLFFDVVDAQKFFIKLNTTTEHNMTPAMFEYNLFEKAHRNKKTIVLPESCDERILRSTEIILRRGIANIILLGNKEQIKHKAGVLGLNLSKAQIIDPNESELTEQFAQEFYELRKQKGLQIEAARDAMAHVSYFGTMLVYKGLADGMVSGAIHTTADTIRPALQIIKTKPGISIVSSVFFMCLDTKVLVYGDCAVNQNPNENELAQIAISSAQTAKSFGIEPKIAMLSYSTGSSGSGEDVIKVRNATEIAKQIDQNLQIEGPIQYDAATDIDVAKTKLPNSKVAGYANVLIFPDLNTGNNTYKAVQRSSGAIAVGPVLQGLNKPINDLSRGCLVADIVNTVAITAIQAGEK
jgi:phosphate acetyltransferase